MVRHPGGHIPRRRRLPAKASATARSRAHGQQGERKRSPSSRRRVTGVKRR